MYATAATSCILKTLKTCMHRVYHVSVCFVCTCMCIYIHTYIHIYMHACIHTYIYMD